MCASSLAVCLFVLAVVPLWERLLDGPEVPLSILHLAVGRALHHIWDKGAQ